MERSKIVTRTGGGALRTWNRDGVKRGPQWSLIDCCNLMGIHYQQYVKWGKKYPGQPQPTVLKQGTRNTCQQALYDKHSVIRWIRECIEAEKHAGSNG